MKITYLLDTFPKRSETFVLNEISWMSRANRLAKIIAINVDKIMLSELEESLAQCVEAAPFRYIGRAECLTLVPYWLSRAPWRFRAAYRSVPDDPRFVRYFWNAAAIARRLSFRDCQLIHVHFAGSAAQVARYISLLTGIPFTFCVHGYDLFFLPPPNYADLARDAALLFTISRYNRRYLIENYRLPESKIRVVHCGIDLEKFCPGTRADREGDTPPVLVSVGRLIELKAHCNLIAACAILANQNIAFQLRIIGEGELRASLECQISNLGLNDRVQLIGAQPIATVRYELSRADMFVLPSLSEGIPVALMEAMAVELPAIATRVRGVPELVEDGRNGLLVDAGAPPQLARAIAGLIADPERGRRLGKAARIKVASEFNAATEYEKLFAIWQCEVLYDSV